MTLTCRLHIGLYKLATTKKLNVRNTFNFVKWKNILRTLDNTFQVLSYLLRILKDYLRNRSLLYERLEGQRRMEVTSGIAQGSILMHAPYKSLLKLKMTEELRLIGYAGDVAGREVFVKNTTYSKPVITLLAK